MFDRADAVAGVVDPVFRTLCIADAGTFSLLLIVLVAVYGRQAGRSAPERQAVMRYCAILR
ncbi:hypothetical protein ACVGOW_11565 [Pseudonocardia saturnea]